MGINSEREVEANLQIGPTDRGMVRLFIEAGGQEIPMDFDPDEAEEIAEEIMAAVRAARARGGAQGGGPSGRAPGQGGGSGGGSRGRR
ncbi:MAG: hypothetical protein IT542_04715 [Rubellimicrobium sp.]|nr:hypothetical protein [Rubellimicrobium sp.]